MYLPYYTTSYIGDGIIKKVIITIVNEMTLGCVVSCGGSEAHNLSPIFLNNY